MTALTHQKYELRQEAYSLMLAVYDAADEVEQRKLFENVLHAVSMRYTVQELRLWITNIHNVYDRPKVQP